MEEIHSEVDISRPCIAGDWIDAVENLPDQDDVIEALLPCGETMLITGGPFVGKSLEVQNLACQFPQGGNFHGLKLKKCDVLYVTWEGSRKGIKKRFKTFLSSVPKEFHPVLHRAYTPIFFNTPGGVAEWCKVITETREKRDVKVVVVDSFTYTVDGDTKQDKVMNPWWESVQSFSAQYGLSFIFTWERTKPIMFKGKEVDTGLSRIKSTFSSAYKVNTAVEIIDISEVTRDKSLPRGETGNANVRRERYNAIVVMKAKDMGVLTPLRIKLDPDTLLFNGQHWQKNPETEEYDAVDSEERNSP